MAFKLNPITGKLDQVQSIPVLDERYVNVTGDTMTGDLIFPATGFILTDQNGVQWRATAYAFGDTANVNLTKIITTDPGFPYGLSLYVLYDPGSRISVPSVSRSCCQKHG